jgi:hypothetical protein
MTLHTSSVPTATTSIGREVKAMRTAIEALFDAMVSDGWANESSGDTEAPTGWFARISNSAAELGEVTDAFSDVIEVYGRPADGDMTGHFLVTGDSLGFIYVTRYETEAELIEEYQRLDREYDTWNDDGTDY